MTDINLEINRQDINITANLMRATLSSPWVDVRDYPSFSAAIDAIGGLEKTLLIPNQQNVTGNKTAPANVVVKVLKGGSLTSTNSSKVTFNGPFEAGLYHVFKGNLVVEFGAGSVKAVYPEWWNFSTSGTEANNTTAFMSAVSSMSAGQNLIILAGTHKITNVVFNPPDGCGLLAYGTLESAANGVAFTIGDSTGATPARRYAIHNLKVISTSTDHTSGRIGILVRNIDQSYIDIRQVAGFETGVKLYGDGCGCVYNEIHFSVLWDNKFSLHLDAANGGWTNENNFYGGRFSWQSAQDTAGFRHIWIDYYVTHTLNNNRFYSPSLESPASTGADTACGIYNEGLFSFFYTPRFELDAANTKAEFTSNSTDSVILFGYGFLTISDIIDSGSKNKFFNRNEIIINGGASNTDGGVLRVKNVGTEGTAPCYSAHGTDGISNARIFGSGRGEFAAGIGVGNSAAGNTLGNVIKKIEIFDEAGNSLGFFPVYDAITQV